MINISLMSQPLQYLTNEQGERVGVLLDWNTYARLTNPLGLDEQCLVGLSIDELTAQASCKLAAAEQTHLNDLVSRNTESLLSTDEIAELDDLLVKLASGGEVWRQLLVIQQLILDKIPLMQPVKLD